MLTAPKFLTGLVLAGSLAFAGAASAEDLPASAEGGDAELLSLEDMGALSGGTGADVLVITEQTLNAVNHGNNVIGETIVSGDVSLATNAFSGYSGLGNFIINTGHNNNLQSSMNVSIVLPEAP